jgi:hypothetical protein
LVILALCRDLFEKLTIAQLVMDVPAFSVTWRFITMCRASSHWTLPSATWINYTHPHPISVKIIFHCTFPFTPMSTKWLLPFRIFWYNYPHVPYSRNVPRLLEQAWYWKGVYKYGFGICVILRLSSNCWGCVVFNYLLNSVDLPFKVLWTGQYQEETYRVIIFRNFPGGTELFAFSHANASISYIFFLCKPKTKKITLIAITPFAFTLNTAV